MASTMRGARERLLHGSLDATRGPRLRAVRPGSLFWPSRCRCADVARPVAIDVEHGLVHPLTTPEVPGWRMYFNVAGLLRGQFAVARPGSGCLNIRDAPSLTGTVQRCWPTACSWNLAPAK